MVPREVMKQTIRVYESARVAHPAAWRMQVILGTIWTIQRDVLHRDIVVRWGLSACLQPQARNEKQNDQARDKTRQKRCVCAARHGEMVWMDRISPLCTGKSVVRYA